MILKKFAQYNIRRSELSRTIGRYVSINTKIATSLNGFDDASAAMNNATLGGTSCPGDTSYKDEAITTFTTLIACNITIPPKCNLASIISQERYNFYKFCLNPIDNFQRKFRDCLFPIAADCSCFEDLILPPPECDISFTQTDKDSKTVLGECLNSIIPGSWADCRSKERRASFLEAKCCPSYSSSTTTQVTIFL